MTKRRNKDITVEEVAGYLANMQDVCTWESRDFKEGLFYRAYISPETGELVDNRECSQTIEFIEFYDGEDNGNWDYETLSNIDFYMMCKNLAYKINDYVHENMPIYIEVEIEFIDILSAIQKKCSFVKDIYYNEELIDIEIIEYSDYEDCCSIEKFKEWIKDCWYETYEVQKNNFDYRYKIQLKLV